MAEHSDDGRVWAVDKKNKNKKVREFPHIIRMSPFLEFAPSVRANHTQQVTEPAQETQSGNRVQRNQNRRNQGQNKNDEKEEGAK